MDPKPSRITRRTALKGALVASAAAAVAPSLLVGGEKAVMKGNIRQSIVFWCFNTAGDKWDLEKTCQVAKSLGCLSVEIVGPEGWSTLKKHDLMCAIAPNGLPGMPFVKGLNNPKYHDEVLTTTKKMIDDCSAAKVPSVISFTGYKWKDAEDPKSGEIPRDQAADHCVKALKNLAAHAEKKGVTVCVEHLNTRDGSHPMKGHPGYHGDDLDWVAGILRRVGSERVKLLFDIYHVQIMHGDVIRRLEQCKDLLGHIHTAGNPGRGELDENQEINYPPIMRKLLDLKYTGYVGQEFIPTRDPVAGLTQAVKLCDV